MKHDDGIATQLRTATYFDVFAAVVVVAGVIAATYRLGVGDLLPALRPAVSESNRPAPRAPVEVLEGFEKRWE